MANAQRPASFGRRSQAYAPSAVAVSEARPAKIDARSVDEARETTFPIVACGILAVLALIFAVEVAFGVEPARPFAPSPRTLTALGSLSWDLVSSGQWWRIFTAPFLHANLAHLVSNAVALLLAGVMLEPVIGHRWFGAAFVVGALAGGVGSLCLNAPQLETVGASGAIMALLGAAFVASFGDTVSPKASKRIRAWSLRLILPALLPMATVGASHVDYSGHLGGVTGGGILGFALQAFWPSGTNRPASPRAAVIVAAIGVLMTTISFGLVAFNYQSYAKPDQSGLIPWAEVPESTKQGIVRSSELLARYPNDSRTHLFRALAFVEQKDFSDAEDQLDAAKSLAANMPDDYRKMLEVAIAVTMVGEGHVDQAHLTSRAACSYVATSADLRKENDILMRAGVCR